MKLSKRLSQRLKALFIGLTWASLAPLTQCEAALSQTVNFANNAKDLGIFFATSRLNEGTSAAPVYAGTRHLDLSLGDPEKSPQGSNDYGLFTFLRPDKGGPLTASGNWASLRAAMDATDNYWKIAKPQSLTGFSEAEFLSRVGSFHGLIVIYVHGYDETLTEAATELAELADEYKRRMPARPIFPILYSWPSPGNKADYTGDEANLEWSEKPFKEFIDKVSAAKASDSDLDFVGHSMGSRYAFAYGAETKDAVPFRNVFLSCSDIDYHVAEERKTSLQRCLNRTLYVLTNDNDGALLTSQVLHGQPRLGRPGDSGTQIRETAASTFLNSSGNLDKAKDLLSKKLGSGLLGQLAESYLKPSQATTGAQSGDVSTWLSANPALSRSWGAKARLIDTTGLVTVNMGHHLAWPLVAGLLMDPPTTAPFVVSSVHKRPDASLLKQMGGVPKYLYRFDKIDLSRIAP
jgi:hypothetical protein